MSMEKGMQNEKDVSGEWRNSRIKKKLSAISMDALLLVASVVTGGLSGTAVKGLKDIARETKKEQEVEKVEQEKRLDRQKIEALLREPKYKNLVERFGSKVVEDNLLLAFQVAEDYRSHESKKPGVEVSAIETKDGELQQSQVQDALASLPQGWVLGKVGAVHYLRGIERESKGYAKNGAIAETGSTKEGKSDIRFFGSAKDQKIGWILHTLDHESGHANDWIRNPNLSLEERMDFLLRVSDRSFAADRYNSSYVERIEEKDRARENYDKTIEYWAEVCSAYFNHPKDLDIRDFILVDHVVKKSDPKYDPLKAAQFNRALADAVRSQLIARTK